MAHPFYANSLAPDPDCREIQSKILFIGWRQTMEPSRDKEANLEIETGTKRWRRAR